MKTFVADLIPKIQQFSKQLDDVSVFTNKHWVLIDNVNDSKTVYIFRGNSELLISKNGKVNKAKWEYLGNRFLLIDLKDTSYLFKLDFTDDSVLALKIDSSEEYAFMINEIKFGIELNSYDKVIGFLKYQYLSSPDIKRLRAEIIPGKVEKNIEAEVIESKYSKREEKPVVYEPYEKAGVDSTLFWVFLLLLLAIITFGIMASQGYK